MAAVNIARQSQNQENKLYFRTSQLFPEKKIHNFSRIELAVDDGLCSLNSEQCGIGK